VTSAFVLRQGIPSEQSFGAGLLFLRAEVALNSSEHLCSWSVRWNKVNSPQLGVPGWHVPEGTHWWDRVTMPWSKQVSGRL